LELNTTQYHGHMFVETGKSCVLWCLVGRWQSMRWAGPGRDSSRPTSKQAGRQLFSSNMLLIGGHVI